MSESNDLTREQMEPAQRDFIDSLYRGLAQLGLLVPSFEDNIKLEMKWALEKYDAALRKRLAAVLEANTELNNSLMASDCKLTDAERQRDRLAAQLASMVQPSHE